MEVHRTTGKGRLDANSVEPALSVPHTWWTNSARVSGDFAFTLEG